MEFEKVEITELMKNTHSVSRYAEYLDAILEAHKENRAAKFASIDGMSFPNARAAMHAICNRMGFIMHMRQIPGFAIFWLTKKK